MRAQCAPPVHVQVRASNILPCVPNAAQMDEYGAAGAHASRVRTWLPAPSVARADEDSAAEGDATAGQVDSARAGKIDHTANKAIVARHRKPAVIVPHPDQGKGSDLKAAHALPTSSREPAGPPCTSNFFMVASVPARNHWIDQANDDQRMHDVGLDPRALSHGAGHDRR
eukprot:6184324-Pleurochrysis_carterae.AAC.1